MHVGVEKSVAQGVAQETLDHVAAERRQIETARFQRGAIVERRAVDPLQRQHVTRGAVPVDRRHAEVAIVLGVLGHLRGSGGLKTEIHFDLDRARQCGDRLDRTQTLRFARHRFCGARSKKERRQIGIQAALDAGAQHFHRDGLAFAIDVDLGFMHLGDRRRGNRGSETDVGLIERTIKGGDDDGFRLGLRKRRHAVLQAFEAAGDVGADNVRPRRHELAELDVSRAEFGQRRGKTAGAVFGALV